jgi:hypothetical protein
VEVVFVEDEIRCYVACFNPTSSLIWISYDGFVLAIAVWSLVETFLLRRCKSGTRRGWN